MAAALGLLGMVLAIVGVYGVISYVASQQTHEIGVRMALGAASIVKSFLVVSATDPLTYVSVSALLTSVALLAFYIPARRAMRVDPMTALHYE